MIEATDLWPEKFNPVAQVIRQLTQVLLVWRTMQRVTK